MESTLILVDATTRTTSPSFPYSCLFVPLDLKDIDQSVPFESVLFVCFLILFIFDSISLSDILLLYLPFLVDAQPILSYFFFVLIGATLFFFFPFLLDFLYLFHEKIKQD
eukprot:GHVR01051907.1.p1 GENE.GHVR01051907.1~~GHVR01051907.1.p1  ORF type:complete len:110 (-),score=3.36 GHVR01051907.1:2063-2392(-)